MRATWRGARSGRIAIVTGPLDVSSTRVYSESCSAAWSGFWGIGVLGFLFLARFNDRDREGAARNSAAKLLGDRQRGAAVEHVDGGALIGRLDLGWHPGRREGEARLAENFAVPGESEPQRDPHARPGDIQRRHLQAFRQERPDLVQP